MADQIVNFEPTEELPVKVLGNDLFAEFECECPSELFKDTHISHIMKKIIRLSGYNDDYFFDEVNKEHREYNCTCGKKYLYRWRRYVVDIHRI